MTEQRAEGRGQRMRSRRCAARRDQRASIARPSSSACVFLVTLLAALPFAMVMRDALQAHLGNSMVAEQVAHGVNVQWWSEFTEQAGTLGKTFQPGIIGFAAVLDNLSAFADGEARPSPLLWLGACYLLLWLFLAGGILDRYARARPTRSYEFFTACGVYFVRFLRLAPFIALTYYVLFAVVHPLLFEQAVCRAHARRHRRANGVSHPSGIVCSLRHAAGARQRRLRLRQGARGRRRSPEHDRRDRRRRDDSPAETRRRSRRCIC